MVGRREEKRWLREVRATTSDTTVIPPLWWVREREERKSECDCVQLWSRVEWQLIVFLQDSNFKLSLWQFVLSDHGADGLLWLDPAHRVFFLFFFLKGSDRSASVTSSDFLDLPGSRLICIVEICDDSGGDWTFYFLLLITWNLCYKRDGVRHTWARKRQIKAAEHGSCIMGNAGCRKSGFLGLCSFDSSTLWTLQKFMNVLMYLTDVNSCFWCLCGFRCWATASNPAEHLRCVSPSLVSLSKKSLLYCRLIDCIWFIHL